MGWKLPSTAERIRLEKKLMCVWMETYSCLLFSASAASAINKSIVCLFFCIVHESAWAISHLEVLKRQRVSLIQFTFRGRSRTWMSVFLLEKGWGVKRRKEGRREGRKKGKKEEFAHAAETNKWEIWWRWTKTAQRKKNIYTNLNQVCESKMIFVKKSQKYLDDFIVA